VSSFQQAGIPTDLKRKIAQLGIHMLLKMVSSWAVWVLRSALGRLPKGAGEGAGALLSIGVEGEPCMGKSVC
jgi:hypothetical protein